VCAIRMPCGHSCEKFCHFFEANVYDTTGHDKEKCMKRCVRPLECGHKCTRNCYECKQRNQPCETNVEHIIEQCGHTNKFKCSDVKSGKELECDKNCERLLDCGH